MSLAITVYHIWRKGNKVMFQQASVTPIGNINSIVTEMRYVGATWHVIPRSRVNWCLIKDWGYCMCVLTMSR